MTAKQTALNTLVEIAENKKADTGARIAAACAIIDRQGK